MTTEGMPERIWVSSAKYQLLAHKKPSDVAVYQRHEYTRTSWLIERLTGMKKERPCSCKEVRCNENAPIDGHNAAIDAVIAMVREG